jgi:transposase
MTIATLKEKGVPNTEAARMLEVTEGAVRYHLRRAAAGAVDGRSRQTQRATTLAAVIADRMANRCKPNLADLHELLVAEHGYQGSLRSVQRYVRKHFPKPRVRARRRVETPPGAQAQADWAEHRGVWVAGRQVDLYAFHMQLSHSRCGATVWSASKDQLAWQQCHVGAFQRLGGVPAVGSRVLPVRHRHALPARQCDDGASAVTLRRRLNRPGPGRSRATGAIRRCA